MIANYHHIFWDRSGIVGYWRAIRDSMEKVLKIKIEFSFQILYLDRKPPQLLGFHKVYMFRIMLVAN